MPYVTINFEGWDTHKGNFQAMQRKLPELDKGFATLLQDLSDHGLLDSTIVWWGGEFGRTPKIAWEAPWNGGRHHYGKVFCHVVAGGGFKGGHVVGSSTEKGEEVKERRFIRWTSSAACMNCSALTGPRSCLIRRALDVTVLPSGSTAGSTGGRLTEIM